MHILLDALAVKPGQGGIRSVALQLCRSFALESVPFSVLAASDTPETWPGAVDVIRADVGRNSPIERKLWRKRYRDRAIRDRAIDAVLTVTPEFTPSAAPVNLMMVHDIGPLLAPGLYGRTRFLRYALTLGSAIRAADATICVSASAKFDLLRWFGLGIENRLHVVRNVAETTPVDVVVTAEERDYALYVGSYLAHKNVGTVLRAFAESRNGSLPRRLVCVGPDYGGEKAAVLGPYGGAEWLDVRGFVSDEELARLYGGAAVVVFPSLSEGFGLPVIEALRSGAPVVATRLPVIEEIAQDAVHFVDDATSSPAWADAIAATIDAPPSHRWLDRHGIGCPSRPAKEILAVIDKVAAPTSVPTAEHVR